MTHKDIYTKFMIEYDKANVASSYPSLTEYEIATILDKAYNALIAQKFTGNNPRRSSFESDSKSISDLQPLITSDTFSANLIEDSNEMILELPDNFLYYVSSCAYYNVPKDTEPMDKIKTRSINIKLVDHNTASKFIISQTNLPWIKNPVGYIRDNVFIVVYDPLKQPTTDVDLTYIRTPNTFIKEKLTEGATFFSWVDDTVPDAYMFECNDTVAEELISLAVTFALENVESQRLNTKLNMRGLEA